MHNEIDSKIQQINFQIDSFMNCILKECLHKRISAFEAGCRNRERGNCSARAAFRFLCDFAYRLLYFDFVEEKNRRCKMIQSGVRVEGTKIGKQISKSTENVRLKLAFIFLEFCLKQTGKRFALIWLQKCIWGVKRKRNQFSDLFC